MLSTVTPSDNKHHFEESKLESESKKIKEFRNSLSKKQTSSFNPPTVVITGQSQKCSVCTTPVYPAERIIVDNFSFHPNCFRCQHCKQLLSLSNSEKIDGRFYCKAHFKLYSSGGDIYKSNPFMANARYSSVLPLSVESQEALGTSINGKKAAYECLVDAGGNKLSHKKSCSETKFEEPMESSLKRLNRLERTRSLFIPSVRNKESEYGFSKSSKDLPVSRIVQNRLRLYERTEEPLPSKPSVKRGLSLDTSSHFFSESLPTSHTDNVSVLSPTNTYVDSSFVAASKTNLKSRIQSYQGKWNNNSISGKNSLLEEISEEDNTITISRTFKSMVESLIKYGRQNDTEIKIRENLSRHRSVRVRPSKPTSSPTHHSSEVNVEGEVTHRRIVSDNTLMEILNQVNKLSPPVSAQETIQNQIQEVDQRLMEKDEYIEKLQGRIAQLELLLVQHQNKQS